MARLRLSVFGPLRLPDALSWWGGQNVILHGRSIGANSLIGMGMIVLDGARAASARTGREIKMIAGGADVYVRRFKQYAKHLKPIG
jgi:tetrahydrodipicolinate N-succinyltransferase